VGKPPKQTIVNIDFSKIKPIETDPTEELQSVRSTDKNFVLKNINYIS